MPHEFFKEVRGRLHVQYVTNVGMQVHVEDDKGNLISLWELIENYDYKACNHLIRIAIMEETVAT